MAKYKLDSDMSPTVDSKFILTMKKSPRQRMKIAIAMFCDIIVMKHGGYSWLYANISSTMRSCPPNLPCIS